MLTFGIWRCADCNSATFTALIADPARCFRRALARYAWKPAPFGRIQRVPPREAAQWEREEPSATTRRAA